MRAWIEDIFAALCWVAMFCGFAALMVGFSA
jgi:hypothetical protein